MASQIEYRVPPAPFPGARDELADVIETLHTSGALRVLNGFFGRLGAVSEVVTSEINSPEGRNVLGTLLFIGECLTKMPVDELQRAAAGFSSGTRRAHQVLAEKPPSTLALFRLLHDPDTRRALAAMLVLLNAVGAELGKKSK